MLTCANCGHEEPEGARFCGNCAMPFAPADSQPADAAAMEPPATLTCTNCGNEEPEGSRFCGNCSAPLATFEELAELEPAEHELAHTASMEAALMPETPPPEPAVEQLSQAEEARPAPPPKRKRRLFWVAAGVAGLLLVAGGATTAVLLLAGGEGSTEVITASSNRRLASHPSPCLRHRTQRLQTPLVLHSRRSRPRRQPSAHGSARSAQASSRLPLCAAPPSRSPQASCEHSSSQMVSRRTTALTRPRSCCCSVLFRRTSPTPKRSPVSLLSRAASLAQVRRQ